MLRLPRKVKEKKKKRGAPPYSQPHSCSSMALKNYIGSFIPPVEVRRVEGKTIITGFLRSEVPGLEIVGISYQMC